MFCSCGSLVNDQHLDFLSDPLVRPTEQLRTAGSSERKNEPLSVSMDSEVCLDMLREGGGSKQKAGGEGGQKDWKL